MCVCVHIYIYIYTHTLSVLDEGLCVYIYIYIYTFSHEQDATKGIFKTAFYSFAIPMLKRSGCPTIYP